MVKKNSIVYISLFQIFGPVFVVLGHSLNGLDANGFWYVFSKEWIYIFHMPLFFFVSGYLLAHNGYLRGRPYHTFVMGKSMRLILPYLFWNLIFWIPKAAAGQFISDNTPVGVFELLKAFVYPRQNILGHTWFLAALFLLYLITPLFERILSRGKVSGGLTVLVAVILYVLPIRSEFLAFSDLHKDLLFFVLGCLFGQMTKEHLLQCMKCYRWIFAVGAVAFSVVALLWVEKTAFRFIPCFFILMFFLSVFSSVEKLSPKLLNLAGKSFGIYILHWPVMFVVRIICTEFLSLGMPLTAFLMSVLGWGIPVLVIDLLRLIPWDFVRKPLKYLVGV